MHFRFVNLFSSGLAFQNAYFLFYSCKQWARVYALCYLSITSSYSNTNIYSNKWWRQNERYKWTILIILQYTIESHLNNNSTTESYSNINLNDESNLKLNRVLSLVSCIFSSLLFAVFLQCFSRWYNIFVMGTTSNDDLSKILMNPYCNILYWNERRSRRNMQALLLWDKFLIWFIYYFVKWPFFFSSYFLYSDL